MATETSIVDMACNALGVSSRSLAKFFNIDFSNLHKFHLGKRSIGNDVQPMMLSDLDKQELQKEAAYCQAGLVILQRKHDFCVSGSWKGYPNLLVKSIFVLYKLQLFFQAE